MPELTEEQRRAANSVDSHTLVSAGAGAGKTMVLIERYVEILKQRPELSVSNIVAMTYTSKAADEMKNRLRLRFKDLADESAADAPPAGADQQLSLFARANQIRGSDSNRWAQCLAEIESAKIGTIHSLCQTMLRAFPAEAGVDPQFETLDDLERAKLKDEAIEKSLTDALVEQSSEHRFLLCYPIEQVKDWMARLLNAPAQFELAAAKLGDFGDQESLCSVSVLKFVNENGRERVVIMLARWRA